MKSNRGETTLIILGVLALLGIGAWATKSKWLHGDSRRAKTSTETTEALVVAVDKKSAVAAASVVKMVEANSEAPDSPQKTFIGREGPVALANLPAPDAQALIEAEKRKAAVLEGRLQEAATLYGDAMKRADVLERERAAALAAKRASDEALNQVAAERRSAEEQRFWAFCIAGAIAALYAWTKITHVSPWSLARSVADIRNGTGETNLAITAIDTATTPTQQAAIKANAWVHAKLAKLFS